MEVITSHINADFDTFASMIAAKKLYPEAHLVFSGSLEKDLREGLKLIKVPFHIEKAKEIDLKKVKRLILVDTRQSGRIGPFSEVVCKPGIDIHIYDHHPPQEDSVKGSFEAIEPYGSTTTVLTLIIRDRGIKLTPEEATILMAGIYEDTGSLMFPSTTTKDFEAASFLLSSGADLRVVSDLLKKELTPEEVSLLDEFLHSQTTYVIGGVEVVIAEGYLEKYVGDIAVLAHKIRDIEKMGSLFVIVDTEDRVHIVARSRIAEIDSGKILRELGGGGHSHAASATLKGVTLIQAKEMLLSAVKKYVLPRKTASDIMSFPPITVPSDTTLKNAVEIMRKYGINAAPVTKNGTVPGVITRHVIDKAVYHGLGSSPVSDYMTTDFEWVDHNTPIEEIREKVIGHGQRLLPVMKDRKITGVITRTDLLKLLQEELRERPGKAAQKIRVVSKLMKETLPPWAYEMLKEAGQTAEELGFKAYAVGGFVRDQLLRRENLDIDIVIEGGDGIVFAEEFAKRKGLRVKPHHRFRTAVLIFPDGFKVDVATARLEYYEKPGALPTVEQSSLKLDLYRRDFIINTLAVALNPKSFGELIDFFGAQKDIKEKTIRVLHNLSFVEDPTRMLRAVRFSEKFGFRIGKHTLNLIKNSVKLDIFRELSGSRVFDELKNILEEDVAIKSLAKLDELGILALLDKKLEWDIERENFLERTRETAAWYGLLYAKERIEGWLVLFLALTDPLTEEELSSLVKRLIISGKKRLEVLNARTEGIKALNRIKIKAVKKNSEIYELIKTLPLEVILYLIAKTQDEYVKKALSSYITRFKDAETSLKGADLRKMGFPQSPEIGEVLNTLLEKRIDGEISTKEDEEEFVSEYLRKKNKKTKPVKARAK